MVIFKNPIKKLLTLQPTKTKFTRLDIASSYELEIAK